MSLCQPCQRSGSHFVPLPPPQVSETAWDKNRICFREGLSYVESTRASSNAIFAALRSRRIFHTAARFSEVSRFENSLSEWKSRRIMPESLAYRRHWIKYVKYRKIMTVLCAVFKKCGFVYNPPRIRLFFFRWSGDFVNTSFLNVWSFDSQSFCVDGWSLIHSECIAKGFGWKTVRVEPFLSCDRQANIKNKSLFKNSSKKHCPNVIFFRI